MIKPKTVWLRSLGKLPAKFKMWGRNFSFCLLLVINGCVTYYCIFYPIYLTKQELCNSARFTAVRSYDDLTQVYDHDFDSPRMTEFPKLRGTMNLIVFFTSLGSLLNSIGTNWERFQRMSWAPCHGVINVSIESSAKNYSPKNFTVGQRITS